MYYVLFFYLKCVCINEYVLRWKLNLFCDILCILVSYSCVVVIVEDFYCFVLCLKNGYMIFKVEYSVVFLCMLIILRCLCSGVNNKRVRLIYLKVWKVFLVNDF